MNYKQKKKKQHKHVKHETYNSDKQGVDDRQAYETSVKGIKDNEKNASKKDKHEETYSQVKNDGSEDNKQGDMLDDFFASLE